MKAAKTLLKMKLEFRYFEAELRDRSFVKRQAGRERERQRSKMKIKTKGTEIIM